MNKKTKKMKKYLFLFILSVLFFIKSDGQDVNLFDGPFVSYHNDSVISRSVNPDNAVSMPYPFIFRITPGGILQFV
jgi:hypothetical protein